MTQAELIAEERAARAEEWGITHDPGRDRTRSLSVSARDCTDDSPTIAALNAEIRRLEGIVRDRDSQIERLKDRIGQYGRNVQNARRLMAMAFEAIGGAP